MSVNEYYSKLQSLQGGNQYLLSYVDQYVNQTILAQIREQNQTEEQTNFLLAQLKIVTELLPFVHAKPLDSIFNRNIRFNTIQVDDPQNLKEQLKKFYSTVDLGHAYVNAGKEYTNKYIQEIVRNVKAIMYISSNKEMNLAALKAITNPTIEHALTLWRIIDTSNVVRQHYKVNLERVKLKKIIHLPRLFTPLSLESLNSSVIPCRSELVTMAPSELFRQGFRDIRKKQLNTDIRVRILSQCSQIFQKQVSSKDMQLVVNELSNSQTSIIRQRSIQQVKQSSNFFSCCMNRNKLEQDLKLQNIIIHIHGGGFISMSSFSHQDYTRKWINNIPDAILFSIDYRLAPENPFPDGLDDCWQVYLWIIHFGPIYLKINVKNIILTGDSAGGNLAMALTIRAIEMGIRIPDKIVLQYPALNLNINDIVPSNLLSLNDKMIPFSLLILCLQSYLKSGASNINPYCSPHYMSQQILDRLPEDLVIFVGNEDVLRDNAIEFATRLKNPKLIIFEGLPHGFQNLGSMIRGANIANQMIIDQLKQYTIQCI